LFSVSTLDPVLMPQFLALSALTFVLILMQYDADSAMLCRAIFPVILCWLFVSAISLIKAVNLTEGIFEWLKLFLNMAFFYAATRVIGGDENGILNLTRAVIISAMMHAVIGIMQYYDLAFTFIPGNFKIYGTMANKNLFASAVFLMTPFALYGILQFSGAWRRISITSASLLFFVIVISKTRAVWAAVVLSAIATSLFAAYKKISLGLPDPRKITIIAIAGGAILISAARLGSASFTTSIFSSDSWKERLMLCEKTLRMIQADPI